MACVSLWLDICGWLDVLYQKNTICSFFSSFFLMTKGLTIPGMFRCFVVRCCCFSLFVCLFVWGDVVVVVVVCLVVVVDGGGWGFAVVFVLLLL